MKFSFTNIVLAGLSIVPLVLGQVPGRDPNVGKSVTVTDDRKDAGDVPPKPAGAVHGVVLKNAGPMLACQTGVYFAPGMPFQEEVNFGPFKGPGTTTSIFKDYKVPQGSVLNPILETNGGPDANLNLWWKVDYNSTCLAIYSCVGSIIKYNYQYEGVACVA
ncbi:hypothetical protein ONZ45_g16085 [Pleurotus djamor]|nr:hypothetical protein ONZ45_g16085 [Pleurotus djamor]